MAEQALEQLEKDVADLRQRVDSLIETMAHIEEDIHDQKFEVRKEYVEKLRRLEKGRFLTQEEFEKAVGE